MLSELEVLPGTANGGAEATSFPKTEAAQVCIKSKASIEATPASFSPCTERRDRLLPANTKKEEEGESGPPSLWLFGS